MYADHQPQIAAASRDPIGFARTCKFVIATVRTRFPDVCADLDRCIAGEDIPVIMFGVKRKGYDWLDENAAGLLSDCEECVHQGDDARLVMALTAIPGIGYAKAGFIAQLVWGRVGCLDTHNLVRYGIEQEAFAAHGRYNAKAAKRYVETCSELGTPETLWNTWCEYVGRTQGYGDANTVSEMHLVCC